VSGRIAVALRVALLAVFGAPVAFVGAFLLLPLWRAIERTTGYRLVGHAVLADECFWATYALWWLVVWAAWRWMRPAMDPGPDAA
jgi:hypothetical protein